MSNDLDKIKRKFKTKGEQEQYEKAIKSSYPMTFEKDKIGGSLADAFNAGYIGLKGGVYRFKQGTAGYIFYIAGKDRKKTDLINNTALVRGNNN